MRIGIFSLFRFLDNEAALGNSGGLSIALGGSDRLLDASLSDSELTLMWAFWKLHPL